MNYELITAEEYDALPEDDDQKFVAIEQICRRSMTQMIDENTRGEFDNLVRMQYMTTVAAAAEELGNQRSRIPLRRGVPSSRNQ